MQNKNPCLSFGIPHSALEKVMGAAGPAILFVVLLATSIIVGVFVLAYAARCVRRYLDDKFGDDLKAVRSAMQKLAKVYKPQELAHEA
jgi:hypothetical protein